MKLSLFFFSPQATKKYVSLLHMVDKTACCRQCTMLFLCWQSLCLETSLTMWWGLKQRDLVSPLNPHTSPGTCWAQLYKHSYRTSGMWMDGWATFVMRTEMPVTNRSFSFFIFPNHFSLSRFKSSALSLSRIHRSHPVPPALRLIMWVEHILHSGSGTHLRPVSLTQPWYQRYLLDLVLLLFVGLLGPLVLCWTFCRNKNIRDKRKKIE